MEQILAELLEYFRALLLYQADREYQEIYLTDTREALAETASLFTSSQIVASVERIHEAIRESKYSCGKKSWGNFVFLICAKSGKYGSGAPGPDRQSGTAGGRPPAGHWNRSNLCDGGAGCSGGSPGGFGFPAGAAGTGACCPWTFRSPYRGNGPGCFCPDGSGCPAGNQPGTPCTGSGRTCTRTCTCTVAGGPSGSGPGGCSGRRTPV